METKQIHKESATDQATVDIKAVDLFEEALISLGNEEEENFTTKNQNGINFRYSALEIGLKIAGVEKVVLSFSRDRINKILSQIYKVNVATVEKFSEVAEKVKRSRLYNKVVAKKLKENSNLLIE